MRSCPDSDVDPNFFLTLKKTLSMREYIEIIKSRAEIMGIRTLQWFGGLKQNNAEARQDVLQLNTSALLDSHDCCYFF